MYTYRDFNKVPSHRIFTLYLIFFLLGIFLYQLANISFNHHADFFIWLIVIMGLSGLIFLLFKVRMIAILAFCYTFLFFGLFYYSYVESTQKRTLPYGQDVEFVAKIISNPEEKAKTNLVLLRVLSAKDNNLLGSKIVAYISKDETISFGDRLKVSAKITKPTMENNFDFERYLLKYPSFGQIFLPEVSKESSNLTFYDKSLIWVYNVNQSFKSSLERTLSEPYASLAKGISLGDKADLPKGLKDTFATLGLSHVLALSGFHITIIVSFLLGLFVPIWGKKITFVILFAILAIFVLMTGASPSIIRAAVISLSFLFGKSFLGRDGDMLNILLFTATLMVIKNPYVLNYNLSFQLSFCAFLGIIYLSPILDDYLSTLKYLPAYIISIFSKTLAAQIATLPLTLFYFSTFSLISPLANLVVLIVAPVVLVLSIAVSLIGIIFYPLSQILALILWPFLYYMIFLSNLLAKIPFASVKIELNSGLFFIVYYLLIFLLAFTLSKRQKLKVISYDKVN